ncbi:MAG: acetyl-CoA carboxylase biotin carboxylase subunit [Alphaproteobacteria bacterium]|nr:acetyl-CoA carboxylase biotin carboxylase subunit [Alphaproteobacteria bacterium]
MFKSIIVANRGEIACRIIRTCKEMAIRSIAVYSEADRNALFVQMADDALCIGPAEARLSYLNTEAILNAARESGAEALHPGYGFLSENAEFAAACMGAGITFIGPDSEAIRLMGSKIEAKKIARLAGVSVVPGYDGEDQSPGTLATEAAKITPPLIIKASAGGGGRGMRRVDQQGDFLTALQSAQKEALAAFGSDAVLLEKYIERPRHIEVQVLCDSHGTVLHLHERDCSVQRNHQKVIEEAPAPDLDPATRQRLTDSALKLAKAINYTSAGTVEFILDRDSGEIYFLEMNTRLQVEHPVTEMITGIDLVEQQIRIASGEALAMTQEQIEVRGWAIEARVAAEDPAQGYMPQTGTISVYEPPSGPGVRCDSGVTRGSSITPWYDSMITKVIGFGADREEARRTLLSALDDYRLGGVGHNLAFLYDITDHPTFGDADIDTTFLDRAFPDGWSAGEDMISLRQKAVAAWLSHRPVSPSPWQTLGSWRLTAQQTSDAGYVYVRENDEAPVEVQIAHHGDTSDVRILSDGQIFVTAGRARNHVFEILLPEQVLLADRKPTSNPDDPGIRAPMPGLISEIRMEPGDQVHAGDTVVVLEAMKLMQNLAAPVSGTVTAVHCDAGETVNGHDLLVDITPDLTETES